MPIAQGLGEALKMLRVRRGWPQKKVAAEAGITNGMVSAYENGRTRPTLATLDKMMAALQADLCDLHHVYEHVHGRPMTAHPLSPHFRPEQARSTAAPPRQPFDRDEIGTEVAEPGGTQNDLLHSADLERALNDMVSGAHRLLRHYFLGK